MLFYDLIECQLDEEVWSKVVDVGYNRIAFRVHSIHPHNSSVMAWV